ncbi:hypothetical protein ABZ442_27630 [Streptomyces triculaminicus]|uniref:hypothetical protein n=1 Tax=Streptomyces triculaminicus TaxID=2816232 RepID=UPI0033F5E4C3
MPGQTTHPETRQRTRPAPAGSDPALAAERSLLIQSAACTAARASDTAGMRELTDEAQGIRQLDLAAREAESSGYEDGAVRALGALLRVSQDEGFRPRYDAAPARLTARP